MVEVVTLDSDDDSVATVDTYNNTLFNLLIRDIILITSGRGMVDALLSSLTDLKDACDPEYLTSYLFKNHIEECRNAINLENCMTKVKELGIKFTARKQDRLKPPPHKRRKLGQPRKSPPITTDNRAGTLHSNSVVTAPSNEPVKTCLSRMAKQLRHSSVTDINKYSYVINVNEDSPPPRRNSDSTCVTEVIRTPQPSSLPDSFPNVTADNIPIIILPSTTEPSSNLTPNPTSASSDIIANLSAIQERFSSDPEVVEVMKILSHEISIMNLPVASLVVEKYCKVLIKLKSAYSLLFHLLRLLKMKYFSEVNPVQIRPDSWFVAPYQAVSYPLSDFVMMSLFKRLLAKVLPESRKPMVDLFGKQFFRASNAEKKVILSMITKVEIVDDTVNGISSKTYKASLLRCLGDCMEIFIKSSSSKVSKTSKNVAHSSQNEDQRESRVIEGEIRVILSPSPPPVSVIIAFPTNLPKYVEVNSPATIDGDETHKTEQVQLCEGEKGTSKEKSKQPTCDVVSLKTSSQVDGVSSGATEIHIDSIEVSSDEEEASCAEQDCIKTPLSTANKMYDLVKKDDLAKKGASCTDYDCPKTPLFTDNKMSDLVKELFSEKATFSLADRSAADCQVGKICETNEVRTGEERSNAAKGIPLPNDCARLSDSELHVVLQPARENAMEEEMSIEDSNCFSGSDLQSKEKHDSNVEMTDSVIDLTPSPPKEINIAASPAEHSGKESSSVTLHAIPPSETPCDTEMIELDVSGEKKSLVELKDSLVKKVSIDEDSSLSDKIPSEQQCEHDAEMTDIKMTETEKKIVSSAQTPEPPHVYIVNSFDEIQTERVLEDSDREVITAGAHIGQDAEIPISSSQISVEFIDELSNDCLITSIKPANIQYVEVSLDSMPAGKTEDTTVQTKFNHELVTNDENTDIQPGSIKTSFTKRLTLLPAKCSGPKPVEFALLDQLQPTSSRIQSDNEETQPLESEDDETVDENAPGYQEKITRIAKLSKKLVRLARRIKAVQAADIDCVEMEKYGNLYLQEEKLKKKHRYVLKELETIQGEMEVHYSFNVKINCGIPKLSKYIEDRLNARQKFPDIEDVTRLIVRRLKDCKMTMKENKINTLAKQIFLDAGSQIQNHRKTELRLDGGFHLMDQVDITQDPAKNDPTLRKRLKGHKSQAKEKLKNIQETFDNKQLKKEFTDKDIFNDEIEEIEAPEGISPKKVSKPANFESLALEKEITVKSDVVDINEDSTSDNSDSDDVVEVK